MIEDDSYDIKMVYNKGIFNDLPELNIITYKDDYFRMVLDLESELFYEFRKKYDIQPYRINELDKEGLIKIREFFNKNKNTFYFLFDGNEIMGCILFVENFLQTLNISQKYQRKGLGTLLTKYGINKAIEKGYKKIELYVYEDNLKAINLYNKLGFEILE